MSRWLKATSASSALVLLCLSSFFPWGVRADDIVITAGNSSEGSSLLPLPRYISWRAKIYGDNYGAPIGPFDDQSGAATSTCAFPCGAGSPFKVTQGGLFTATPMASILHLEGQSYGRWFRGGEFKFSLDSVIIKLGVASSFKWTSQAMMPGMLWFSGPNFETGLEAVTMIPFGDGLSAFAPRYHRTRSNLKLQQGTESPGARSFNFAKRTKPLGREPSWAVATGGRQLFESRIPAQFWRPTDLGDKRIVPATHLHIRSHGYKVPIF